MDDLNINPDIRKAHTLPTSVYKDDALFKSMKEKVFSRTWHWIGEKSSLFDGGNTYPFSYIDKYIPEPLVLTQSENGEVNCLSNVCTHRGNILINKQKQCRKIICGYHARKFSLNGEFEFMPEFDSAENFPTPEDNLARISTASFADILFCSLEPAFEFSDITEVLNEYIGFLPLKELKYKASQSRTYSIKGNWALYCDNYLEGFHIPFVHPGLNQSLDYSSYEVKTFPWMSLQTGIADGGTEHFDLPDTHPDHGRQVAAYYFWIFPNLMLNFYPWGLSVNVVRPVTIDRTEVDYQTFILDETKVDKSAGALLDKVEMEDEEIVEQVQQGVQSRFYKKGRFSPTREAGVHHFHLLLSRALNNSL